MRERVCVWRMGNLFEKKNKNIYPILTVRFSLEGNPFVCKPESFWVYYTGKISFVKVDITSSEFLLKHGRPTCTPLQDYYHHKELYFLYIPPGVEIRHLSPRGNFKGVLSDSHDVLMQVKKRKGWKVYYRGKFSTHPNIDGVFRDEGEVTGFYGRILEEGEKVEVLE